jgi:endonuclease/exonuclease/phosphatase (EEP) superfamily protein YafD
MAARRHRGDAPGSLCRVSPIRTLVTLAGVALAVGLVVVTIVNIVAPQRDGILALSQILAPYLFLLLVPFLLLLTTPRLPGRLLRWTTLVAAIVFLIRFVPVWVALPGSAPAAASGAPRISVASWNLELGQPADAVVVDAIKALDADVMGLVELTPWNADAIAADPVLRKRYRTLELRPTEGSLGIGLLSRLPPIGEPRKYGDPPVLVQQLDAGNGRTLTVVVAHPLPGQIQATADDTLPIGYDSTSRDRHLAQVRGIVDPILASGEPLLLIGDFNVVDREPAYDDLVRGLIDAQRAVGLGPGHTWRPDRLEWLPFGLLRIDYLFSANGVTPVSISPDCTPRSSDHCLLSGVMALP